MLLRSNYNIDTVFRKWRYFQSQMLLNFGAYIDKGLSEELCSSNTITFSIIRHRTTHYVSPCNGCSTSFVKKTQQLNGSEIKDDDGVVSERRPHVSRKQYVIKAKTDFSLGNFGYYIRQDIVSVFYNIIIRKRNSQCNICERGETMHLR